MRQTKTDKVYSKQTCGMKQLEEKVIKVIKTK